MARERRIEVRFYGQILLPAQTALLGSAMGFCYGSQTRAER